MEITALSREIETYIKAEPRFFADVLRKFKTNPYRNILLAWAIIREKNILQRNEEGHYLINGIDAVKD
ncbi:MAG: hypothetical protein K0R22_64 [Sporomusa sp.]|jgi:hypothetical protein|nr:hypothetical protein [Sporomusa sp.]